VQVVERGSVPVADILEVKRKRELTAIPRGEDDGEAHKTKKMRFAPKKSFGAQSKKVILEEKKGSSSSG